jgi:hypothetical protein
VEANRVPAIADIFFLRRNQYTRGATLDTIVDTQAGRNAQL